MSGMIVDIRLPEDFLDSRKTRKLIKRLGLEGVMCLLRLWFFAAKRRTDGVLFDLDDEDIALEAHWDGDGDQFVRTLEEVGFLDRREDGVAVLPDWDEHQPWIAGAKTRSENASKAATEKYRRMRAESESHAESSDAHASRMRRSTKRKANTSEPECPLPSPNPSPSPSPAPASRAPAREDAAVEEPFRSETTETTVEESEGGSTNHTGRPILEHFDQLANLFARMAGVLPTSLNHFRLQALRDICDTLQMQPIEIVRCVERWEQDQAAKKRRPPKVTHPNFFVPICQEYGAARASPTNDDWEAHFANV